MLDLFWYMFSFTLGGVIGAPILLTYGMYLLQRYIDSTPDQATTEPTTLFSEEEEGCDGGEGRPIVVSKVGWIRITHEEKTSVAEPNSNLTEMITNGFQSFLDRKQPTPYKRGKDACYAVLKQDKLMIYDSGNRVECRGVILMSEFTPMIYPEKLPDNEAFKKDYPLLLKYNSANNKNKNNSSSSSINNNSDNDEDNTISTVNTQVNSDDEEVRSDYFIYLDSPVEKESWYIALLNASQPTSYGTMRSQTIDPLSFDRSAIEGLIKTINSNDDHQQTKWLNALIGRIFLGIYKTQAVKDFFINKITTKTTKVKKPGFLGDIHVRDLRVGNSIPYITNPKLLSLSKEGELTAEMDLEYSGGFKAEIETEATLSVSSRLKPLKVNMVLAVVLKSLSGRILLRVKPPPSNRFWIGFYEVPQMSLSIEPMVSDTQIKSTMILQAIERRIHEMFKEAIVLPNMDDFCFFPSYGTGGIFNFAEDNIGSDSEDSPSKSTDESEPSEEQQQPQPVPEFLVDHPPPPEVKVTAKAPSFTTTTSSSTFNEKLRNLKENYFGGRKLKPKNDGSTSPLLPTSPASLSMPNLLPVTNDSKRSPSLHAVDDSDHQVPSPTLSIEMNLSNNNELITTPPPAAFLPPPSPNDPNGVRKRKIIPSFVKLKEHLHGTSFGGASTSNLSRQSSNVLCQPAPPITSEPAPISMEPSSPPKS